MEARAGREHRAGLATALVALACMTGFTPALLDCGGASAPKSPSAIVVLLVDTRGRRLPFDPDAIRGTRAREAVDRVAGHPIALAIDVALLPDAIEGREAYVADSLEALARGLDAEKTRDPAAWKGATGALEEVAFRFDPLAHKVSAKLSDDGKKLVAGTARTGAPPLTSEDFTYLFRKRADEQRRARYVSKRAEDVPREEREAYFRALEDHDDAPRDVRARLGYLADRTLTLLDLHALLVKERDRSQATLADQVRHRLALTGGDVLTEIAYHHPDLFDGAPRDASVRRAEVAYSEFLRRELPRLSDEEGLAATRIGFLRASPSGKPPRYVLPSFDRLGTAIETLTSWKKKGQTSAAATPVVHSIVCPEERVKSGHRIATSRSAYCGEELYQMAREDEGARRALVGYAKREDDAVFVKLLFARLPRDREKVAGTFDALRDVSGTKLFPVAIEAVAEASSGTGDPLFVSEARGLARTLPQARGDIAYLVARSLMHRGSEETFTRFGDLFGAPLELTDYERFMAYGDSAVEATPSIVPSFAPRARGAPRMRVFLTRLDAYLDHADERRAQVGPDRSFSDLRDKLCEDDDDAGVAELARAFAERRKKHPGEVLTEIFADGCPKKDPSANKAGKPDKRPKPHDPVRKPRPMDGGPESDTPTPRPAPPKAPMPRATP